MSELLFYIAQFVVLLWPLFVLTTLVYSLQVALPTRKRKLRLKRGLVSLMKRLRNNLLFTWTILVACWFVTLFAPTPNLGLMPEPWNTGLLLGGFVLLLLAEASELGLFERRLRARVDLHHAQAIHDLKQMDPYAFEMLVSETYRALGYRAQQVGQSGDHGVDVEVRTPNGQEWVVQCKRYRDPVGESLIRELYGTMVSEKADRAVMVTTAEITPPARAWARGKPIDLVDGAALLQLIERAREKSEGTWFDRLAHFVETTILARPIPSALRNGGSQEAAGRTQPVRRAGAAPASAAPAIQYHRGVPVCPIHRMPMLPRSPQAGARLLYRCRHYPTCRIVLEGMPNGAAAQQAAQRPPVQQPGATQQTRRWAK